jgi:hypothetical protein
VVRSVARSVVGKAVDRGGDTCFCGKFVKKE